MVMLEAEHTCMTMRGIKKPGSKTITTVTRGAFTEDKELQKMFLSMVKGLSLIHISGIFRVYALQGLYLCYT